MLVGKYEATREHYIRDRRIFDYFLNNVNKFILITDLHAVVVSKDLEEEIYKT